MQCEICSENSCMYSLPDVLWRYEGVKILTFTKVLHYLGLGWESAWTASAPNCEHKQTALACTMLGCC